MKNKISPSQIKRLIIGLVIMGLAVITAMLIGGPLIFWSLFAWLVNKAVSNVGMNVWLARGLMVPVAALLFYAIGLTFSLKKKKRVTGAILLCVFLCLGSLVMYNFTKEQHFVPKTNEPAQWYSKTPDGYRLFPRPGYDPIIGEKLQKVTPGVAKEIEILKTTKGKLIKPIQEEYQFFDFWGRPIRWYYKDAKDRIEIFNQPGSHPTYGDQLAPINKEIVKEYLEQIRNEKDRETPQDANINPDQPKEITPIVEFSFSHPTERNIRYVFISYEKARAESLRLYLDYTNNDRRFEMGADLKCFSKINDLIKEMGRSSMIKMDNGPDADDIEVLISAWKELSSWKFAIPLAMENVSEIPIFLASSMENKAIEFIRQNLQDIEKNQISPFVGGSNYYGEPVILKVIEELRKNPHDHAFREHKIKDLLSFIAQNSIWSKAKERAIEILTQQK